MINITVTPPPNLKYVVPNYRKALRDTLNDSLEDGQKRGQQLIHQRLTVRSGRSAQFLERLVKFEKFDRATDQKLNAQMGVQSTGTGTTRKSADLLIKLAIGGVFTQPASKPFFIPTVGPFAARPTMIAAIPRALFPSALGLTSTRFTIPNPGKQATIGSRGGVILRGKRRTFAIDPQFHQPLNRLTVGIYQRRGKGSDSETGVLWFYRTRIRIPKRYPFVEVVAPYVQERLPVNLQKAIQKQLQGGSR